MKRLWFCQKSISMMPFSEKKIHQNTSNNEGRCASHTSLHAKQWLAFKNVQKKKICKNQTKISKQRCDSWEHLRWKNAAPLLCCTAHVARPPENVSKHKAVFLVPGLSRPAGATRRPEKRWLNLCLHILYLFCSWWVSHFPMDFFLSIHIYF